MGSLTKSQHRYKINVMEQAMDQDANGENENGIGVSKGGDFLTKCTHPRLGGHILDGLLRLFLEASRRQ